MTLSIPPIPAANSARKPFYRIEPETPTFGASIEKLYDEVFGPSRFQKASYRYRQGISPVQSLSWIATEKDRLIGVIRYWPIVVGKDNHPALLLGPLAIAPDRAGQGIGRALIFHTLEIAVGVGYDLVLLVGDYEYYRRFGFVPATPFGFVMPGESRPERLHVAFLSAAIVGKIEGEIHPFLSGVSAAYPEAEMTKRPLSPLS